MPTSINSSSVPAQDASTTAATPTPAKVDIVKIPRTYKARGDAASHMKVLNKEFMPILGATTNLYYNDTLNFKLIHVAQLENLYFPKDGPRTGQSRFTWFERDKKDGVFYGTKVPDADLSDEDYENKMDAADE